MPLGPGARPMLAGAYRLGDGGAGKQAGKAPTYARRRHLRAPPGILSARSIQFGTAVAPGLPQRQQRIRGPKDATVRSSGQSSILTARSWLQCWQVGNKPRTPCRRMPLSVIERIGSSSPAISTDRERDQVAVIGFPDGNQCKLCRVWGLGISPNVTTVLRRPMTWHPPSPPRARQRSGAAFSLVQASGGRLLAHGAARRRQW
jgi:hypothetical protein